MDTLRNVNYMFSVLSDDDDKNPFREELFMIITYFLNKLLTVRTTSVQLKFKGIFLNDSGCQNFFSKINQYLKILTQKVNNGTLMKFYARQNYTDELSPKSYYVDKNLEKQIIDFIKLLCKNGNTFFQNYMKKQINNSRTFNMIAIVNTFSKELLTHLKYPVAFDTFTSTLSCLLEFIQGPNQTNQNILIYNDFVSEVARDILVLKYHDDEKTLDDFVHDKIGVSNSFRIQSGTLRKTKDNKKSLNSSKSNSNIDLETTRASRPTTNYMISLAKYFVLQILNYLSDGFNYDEYVFYLYRREIMPITFRKILAYQEYFYSKRYGSEYRTELFFSYHENINKTNKSPFIIEIGFECYFLLKKMEENIRHDYDENYARQ
jgi:hypothetical protein